MRLGGVRYMLGEDQPDGALLRADEVRGPEEGGVTTRRGGPMSDPLIVEMVKSSAAAFNDFVAAMDELQNTLAAKDDELRRLIEAINQPDPYETVRLLLSIARSGAMRCVRPLTPEPWRVVRPETIQRCAELTGVR